jgi:hypothetical protein
MSYIDRSWALFFILTVAASSLIAAKTVCAQSMPKPSVPEFTLKIVARPFDVPPVATTNPYNGQTTITHAGYHVANVSVDITIRNQPPYTTNYMDGISVWYEIQFKGAYQTNWQGYSTAAYSGHTPQQIGDYTVISVPINSEEPINPQGEHRSGTITDFPEGGTVDFQVRALIGSFNYILHGGPGFSDWEEFDGEEGDWSNTQTITITGVSQNPAPTSPKTQNPTNYSSGQINISFSIDFNQPFWVVIVTLIVVLVVAALVLVQYEKRWKGHSKGL